MQFQEERFSRKKNDSSFPNLAINNLLKTNKLKLADIDNIVFFTKNHSSNSKD